MRNTDGTSSNHAHDHHNYRNCPHAFFLRAFRRAEVFPAPVNRGRYANDGSEQSNSIANIHATLPLCQCWKFSLILYVRISYIPDILSTSTLAILCY